jgi:hypothetical protein
LLAFMLAATTASAEDQIRSETIKFQDLNMG